MDVGSKIQKIRELKGYTQESVAEAVGISQSAYCNIEKGNTSVSLDKLITIADFFGLTLNQLLVFDHQAFFKNLPDTVQNPNLSDLSDNERRLYEFRIKHLEEEILFLRKKLINK